MVDIFLRGLSNGDSSLSRARFSNEWLAFVQHLRISLASMAKVYHLFPRPLSFSLTIDILKPSESKFALQDPLIRVVAVYGSKNSCFWNEWQASQVCVYGMTNVVMVGSY